MLSNDEGRKISFHFLALPFALNTGANAHAGTSHRSQNWAQHLHFAGISLWKYILHCEILHAQRWPLFSPRDEQRLHHVYLPFHDTSAQADAYQNHLLVKKWALLVGGQNPKTKRDSVFISSQLKSVETKESLRFLKINKEVSFT